jgi:sulfur relay protein TusB/DsrH
MILHTLEAGPGTPAAQQCLRSLSPGDALLLLGDGVYAGLTAIALAAPCPVYALLDDIQSAGVGNMLADGVRRASMDDFVQLTEQSSRQVSWY